MNENQVDRAFIRLVVKDIIAKQSENVGIGGWMRAGSIVRLADAAHNVMIGAGNPTSKLTVTGIIESQAGGFRFPDGSLQVAAAIGSLLTGLGLMGGPITGPSGTVDLRLLAGGGLAKNLGAEANALGITTGGVTDAMLATPKAPATRAISTTTPLTGGGDFSADRTLAISDELEGRTDVTITAAQVRTLNATPRTLVPAPGAGWALVFLGAVFFLDYGAVAYDGIATGEDLAVRYTGASGLQLAQLESIGLLDQTSDQTRWVRPFAPASGDSSLTPVENAPLVLHMLAGEVASGDSPLKVRTYYRKVPMSL